MNVLGIDVNTIEFSFKQLNTLIETVKALKSMYIRIEDFDARKAIYVQQNVPLTNVVFYPISYQNDLWTALSPKEWLQRYESSVVNTSMILQVLDDPVVQNIETYFQWIDDLIRHASVPLCVFNMPLYISSSVDTYGKDWYRSLIKIINKHQKRVVIGIHEMLTDLDVNDTNLNAVFIKQWLNAGVDTNLSLPDIVLRISTIPDPKEIDSLASSFRPLFEIYAQYGLSAVVPYRHEKTTAIWKDCVLQNSAKADRLTNALIEQFKELKSKVETISAILEALYA